MDEVRGKGVGGGRREGGKGNVRQERGNKKPLNQENHAQTLFFPYSSVARHVAA
jgi:hypothetical protein